MIVRQGDEHSVLYGRCLHRGALLADGHVQGDDLICGLHGWDYRIESGVSAYNNAEALEKFTSVLEGDDLFVDRDEVLHLLDAAPAAVHARRVPGATTRTRTWSREEPFVMYIHELAANGLTKTGHHGPLGAMGVPRTELPQWDDIQFVTAQLARLPQLDDEPVGTEVCIGPNADKPLWLDIPLFVSDMSFGALSQEAKTALARGAELAGTGICSGEGGMLPEEQAENSRYFYELASARFGWTLDVLKKVQAFHFKGGQGAKTGTGGHLPGDKVVGKIAEVRGLPEGTAAISPPRFPDWDSVDDFRRFADTVREESGGIPIGFKLSAQHIEEDLDAALVGRRRLRDPRRPRRRHRRRAAALPRQHLGPDDPRARACPRAPRPARPARRHARGHRRAAPRARLRQGARARRRRGRDRELARSRPSAASGCARATPTTARSASPRRSRTCGPGCRSTRPRTGSTGSCARPSS